MLFSSGVFYLFFLIVVAFLCINNKFIKSLNVQNVFLLISSYFFYAYWDWRFLGLVILVSSQTYASGYIIHHFEKCKKAVLFLSLFINLVILGYFKYAGFFISSFVNAFNVDLGFSFENIILPVGISFYIFQSFTYVIDVFYEKIEPEPDPVKYFTFIAFFPQLVAGPIERASSLLPQFNDLKVMNSSTTYCGTKSIIIGLFLKIFVADSIAPFVDQIFSSYHAYNGGTLLLGAIGFSIQIYGDFAGYSLIAIGVAKIMGFSLMKNFDTPYFSTSIQEFWHRWHISLSSFFRDYVYIPLGGSRCSEVKTHRNIMITFVLSGFWHGANWTFLFWGGAHGILLVLQKVITIRLGRILGWITTMSVVLFLWILFRSNSLTNFYTYIDIMVSNPGFPEFGKRILIFALYYLLLDLMLWKYSQTEKTWFSSTWMEVGALSILLFAVLGTIHDKAQDFIYFQF